MAISSLPGAATHSAMVMRWAKAASNLVDWLRRLSPREPRRDASPGRPTGGGWRAGRRKRRSGRRKGAPHRREEHNFTANDCAARLVEAPGITTIAEGPAMRPAARGRQADLH